MVNMIVRGKRVANLAEGYPHLLETGTGIFLSNALGLANGSRFSCRERAQRSEAVD